VFVAWIVCCVPAGGAVPGGTAAVMVTNCNLPLRTLQQLEDAGPALDAFLFNSSKMLVPLWTRFFFFSPE